MSLNRLVQENFDRFDKDVLGRPIQIYRRKVTYRTKAEVKEVREKRQKALDEFKKRFPDAVFAG